MKSILPEYINKVLVTGGAGFIGINAIIKLLKESHAKVYNLDKLSYASDLFGIKDILNTIDNPEDRYEFNKLNLCNYDDLKDYIQIIKPNLILHFAAESHVDRSIDNPREFINSNVVGTFNLLESVRSYYDTLSKDQKINFRFHHISTDEVYGSLGEFGYFQESTPYSPRSQYSASKASSDHFVNAWFHTYGIPVSITNCSNNYGPWQFPEKLIPLVILKAIAGKKIPLYGDGSNIRDWLFIDDHINAIIHAATKSNPGENFCIGGSNEKTNKDVVSNICSILDDIYQPKKPHSQLIEYVNDRPGHDFRYSINSSKIREKLNWEPNYTFNQGLMKTVKWYLKNIDWCEKIQNRSLYQGERLGNLKNY